MKRAREISKSSRQNVLAQVAASEFGECRQQAEMLSLHVGNKNWPISEHISSTLSIKLGLAKAFEKELRGIDRDALDVSVRTASQLREYLSTTDDPEPDKIQKGQEQCRYLSHLLNGIHGSLRLKMPEELL